MVMWSGVGCTTGKQRVADLTLGPGVNHDLFMINETGMVLTVVAVVVVVLVVVTVDIFTVKEQT